MTRLLFDGEWKLGNGLDGDPALLLWLKALGCSVLFDLGDLGQFSQKELLRVRHALVSHTHIDHFIGFDQLLRYHIPHYRPITIAGPAGIAKNVHGKLMGYSWNLLAENQLNFRIIEIHETQAVYWTLRSDQLFLPEKTLEAPLDAKGLVLELEPGLFLRARPVSHGIPSIAFRLDSEGGSRFLVEKLDTGIYQGVKPGPWIKQLQRGVLDPKKHPLDDEMTLFGKTYKTKQLVADLLRSIPASSFGYVTDLEFSRENLDRLQPLFHGVDWLFCEASFRDRDVGRAYRKKHLTTKQAALVAAWCAVRHLQVFHISNIYGGDVKPSVDEAAAFFEKSTGVGHSDLLQQVAVEISRGKLAFS